MAGEDGVGAGELGEEKLLGGEVENGGEVVDGKVNGEEVGEEVKSRPMTPAEEVPDCRVGPRVEDEEVVEKDPSGRFHRYNDCVGEGRFKTVFKGYDTENGVDVAWCKVMTEPHKIADSQLDSVYNEMRKGLTLDHPNIIRCLKCWVSESRDCINLVTELFASGTLREYRQHYRHLGVNALKKYGRQILNGLIYLHSLEPPEHHGDLRLDKIYVNGFNGEAKIGDLGLAPLLAKRYTPEGGTKRKSVMDDIYSFGLCLLELITIVPTDRTEPGNGSMRLLGTVTDESAKRMISQCLGSEEMRPTPSQLLEDDFFGTQSSSASSHVQQLPEVPTLSLPIKVSGEDWNFLFEGFDSETVDGNLRIKLVMSKEDEPEEVTKVNFDYYLEHDTPEKVAGEIADSFLMTATDREICCAALREWLAAVSNPQNRQVEVVNTSPHKVPDFLCSLALVEGILFWHKVWHPVLGIDGFW